ncbi:MAG: exonuclease SbcCD subunit D [Chloroflexota bacterium]|nr:exonuclease SbcCD subunit D [Chloroflexota bacterium]
MKILHFADLHLGVETYGRIDPATGLSTRLNDFLAALDQLVDYALNNDVDLVLFCGDAYKSRDPGQTYQREFARRIWQLSANGIPVFLLVGNHDLPNAVGRATAVEIFDTLAIDNVVVANRPKSYCIETRKGPLQIVALPWVRRGTLLSREDTKNLSIDQINQKLEETLTAWINAQADALDRRLPAVLAAHVSIFSAKLGSERTMSMGREHVLLQSTVAAHAFDYVALGHIHNRQVLSESPPVVYSGSLQTIDFGDEDQEKGFYVVHLDDAAQAGSRLLSYEFQPVEARRFLTIKVDADTDDPTATVLRAITRNTVENAIVRLQIKVPAEREGLIQETEIRKALKDAYFVAAVIKDVERAHRSRLNAYSADGITPLEALRLYLELKKTPRERIQILLEYGESLIQSNRSL